MVVDVQEGYLALVLAQDHDHCIHELISLQKHLQALRQPVNVLQNMQPSAIHIYTEAIVCTNGISWGHAMST